MSGQEKTTKTAEIAKTIENQYNFISEDSLSMLAREFDMCFYIVNKIEKQD